MLRWLLAPILAGALIPVTGSAPGVAQEAVQVRVDAVDTSAYPQLRATVTVLDGSGRPLVGLAQQAFSADADGQTLPVAGLRTALDANVPATVVLVFDTSGSMQGDAIEQARQAGKALVNQLGPADQVAVITFSNTAQIVQGFTSDRGALAAAIDGIAASGNTALYDGVVAAVNTSAQAAGQRRAVVLLSDGVDFGGVSQSDRGSSLAAAQSGGVPFFVVGLGGLIDQPYLQELANATRGQLFVAPSPEALQGLYETIGAALRNQYILDLDATSLDPASAETLRVQVSHAGTVAAGQIALDLSRFVVTAAPTPVATPVATPVEETEGGGSSALLAVVGGAAAVVLLGGGGTVFWLQRRRRAAASVAAQEAGLTRPGAAGARPGEGPSGPVFVGTGPMDVPFEAGAWLEVVAPENLGRFPLGDDPVTVGFTGDCTIVLPSRGQAGSRVRVWRREGRYMLHNLSRLGSVKVGGKTATWAVLEDDDEIEIGGCKLVFRAAHVASDS